MANIISNTNINNLVNLRIINENKNVTATSRTVLPLFKNAKMKLWTKCWSTASNSGVIIHIGKLTQVQQHLWKI